MIRAFLVDDEPLAVKRLARLLEETGRVEIVGTSTDPVDALAALSPLSIDVLFLDIQMPGMNGFEMLSMLDPQPLVVFTTAFDQYALQAFAVNSIDYLLKPIEVEALNRALNKLARIRAGSEPRPELKAIIEQLSNELRRGEPKHLERVASRVGERVQFLPVAQVSHFFAQDKLTYAATASKNFVVDCTISELEQKLDAKKFVRIHRSTLVNLDYLHELDSWFGGGVLARLKDPKATELPVSRDRVKALKQALGVK